MRLLEVTYLAMFVLVGVAVVSLLVFTAIQLMIHYPLVAVSIGIGTIISIVGFIVVGTLMEDEE